MLVKITAPGVPDFYQGSELWDFSMVDPDNRRPVDYLKRITLLEHGDAWALTVTPRWTTQVTSKYRVPSGERASLDTSLRNVLKVCDLLCRFPVALLTNVSA